MTTVDDKQLQLAIETYKNAFSEHDLQIFDISKLDKIGIPVYFAELKTSDGFVNSGFGYGNTANEAMVGALGELSETYHIYKALQTAKTCEAMSFQEMTYIYGLDSVIDPLSLCLSAGYPYNDTLPLRWVAVTKLSDGSQCWAPRESVAFSRFTYEMNSFDVEHRGKGPCVKLFPPITCGLGAGLDIDQALSHAVLEMLQRDGNCTRFRAMDEGVDVELDQIDSDEIKSTILKLKNIGLNIRVKLASTEFGLVNAYVISEPSSSIFHNETFPLFVTACGEAVHQNREQALRKALNEFISSRSRKAFMHGSIDAIKDIAPESYLDQNLSNINTENEEFKSLIEMVSWISKPQAELVRSLKDTVFSTKKTIKFSSIPSTAAGLVLDSEKRLKDLSSRLSAENIAIYYFSNSDDSSHTTTSPKVVKTIVPGLEGETMSYWRIGARGIKRLIEKQSKLISINPPQGQDLLIPLRAEDQLEFGGPVYFRVPELEKTLWGHYPLYREPASHTVQKYIEENNLS